MKPASVSEIKKELEARSHLQLVSFCLRLTKYKKENKELLNFLLFEADDIFTYIESVKQETTALFDGINRASIYYTKKSVRKILRYINKHIRITASKQAEVEILIHFCNSIIDFSIPVHKNKLLLKMYEMQLKKIDDSILTLHPDLQYDLKKQLKHI